MSSKKINKEYLDKIKQLIKYNKSYYDKSNPLISDHQYDDLKNEILNLEKKYKFLTHKDSPSKLLVINPQKILKN